MAISRRFLLGALGTLPMVRRAAGTAQHRLTLLHFNDFHSRHEPVDERTLNCCGGDGCFGGSARLASVLMAARQSAEAEGRAVLLLDGGD